MEEILKILRAKSKDGRSYLLIDHIEESLRRVTQLKRFIEENKKAIKYKNYTEDFFKSLIIACLLHDLGKINPYFQKRVFSKEERKTEEFKKLIDFFGNYRNINIKDHEVISALLSIIFIDNSKWDRVIRTSILLHHYNNFYVNREPHIRYLFDDYPELEKYIDFLISNQNEVDKLLRGIVEVIKKKLDTDDKLIIDTLNILSENINVERIKDLKRRLERGHSLSGLVEFLEVPDKENKEFYDFFVFLGSLRRCDYSASSCVDIEIQTNIHDTIYSRIEEKIEKRVKEMNGEFWQKKIIDNYNNRNGRLNKIVLIAPTGSGKTEFALLWAKNRGKKLLYTLPLRAALNDLYSRFGDEKNGYFNEEYLAILHSTSFIEYIRGGLADLQLNVETKEAASRLLSLPLILSTPDQVFLSSLKYYGFDKLISIYPLSSIVIDEIHAYTPEMIAVILQTLKIIEQLEGDILIMTATFPPYLREFINESRGFKIIDVGNEDVKTMVKNYNIRRHRVEIIDKKIFRYSENKEESKVVVDNEALEKIKEIVKENENKNVLIIVNTVGKAVELFKCIESLVEREINVRQGNLYLLHSRLLEKEKKKRIAEIKEKLEKKGKGENVGGILLIATQVIEASVDIDFDILITEISPIDSQIQRWGRIYRNRDTDYSESHPNIFVFTNIENDRGTLSIYERNSIEKTIEVLKGIDKNLCLGYEEERRLIEEVFEREVNVDGKRIKLRDEYIDRIKENLEWLEYISVEKRSEAQRIFRAIAGLQFVFPSLMIDYGESSLEKAFGEVINEIVGNDKKPGWDEIIKMVRYRLTNEEEKNKVNEFELKKIMYLYSINLPIFLLTDKMINLKSRNEFKGFFVLTPTEIGEESEAIIRYGISKIRGVDVDIYGIGSTV